MSRYNPPVLCAPWADSPKRAWSMLLDSRRPVAVGVKFTESILAQCLHLSKSLIGTLYTTFNSGSLPFTIHGHDIGQFSSGSIPNPCPNRKHGQSGGRRVRTSHSLDGAPSWVCVTRRDGGKFKLCEMVTQVARLDRQVTLGHC
jgi:hypothetical protein